MVKGNLPEVDLARMAAFVDGEGCIGISGKSMTVRLAVTNTDFRLMTWILERFGGTVYTMSDRHRVEKGNKVCYRWQISSMAAAEVIAIIRPYLIMKYDRADVAIEFQAFATASRGGQKPSALRDIRNQAKLDLKQEMHRLNKVGVN